MGYQLYIYSLLSVMLSVSGIFFVSVRIYNVVAALSTAVARQALGDTCVHDVCVGGPFVVSIERLFLLQAIGYHVSATIDRAARQA